VKKIFNKRARLVVYIESDCLEQIAKKARSEGKTLVEWARDVLTVGGITHEDNHHPDVRGLPDVRSDRRSPDRTERVAVPATPATRRSSLKTKKKFSAAPTRCQHGYMVVNGVTACERCKS
jgi:hypothetical protein